LKNRLIFHGTMPKTRLKLPPLKSVTGESLGERLARLRKERGLTQSELAKRIGIIQGLVTNYETDRLRMHHEMVIRFAQALDVSSDELLGIKAKTNNDGPLSLKVVRRLTRIELLPIHQQRILFQTIDAFLKGAKV